MVRTTGEGVRTKRYDRMNAVVGIIRDLTEIGSICRRIYFESIWYLPEARKSGTGLR